MSVKQDLLLGAKSVVSSFMAGCYFPELKKHILNQINRVIYASLQGTIQQLISLA